MQSVVNVSRVRTFDVVVAGGGPAGFPAAVAAARNGAKVALIESYGMLGGAMTVGGIPAPALFHAHGKQIISGIGWELMTRLAEKGYASLPEAPFDAPHPLLACEVNPFQAALEMDIMAEEAGVTLLLRQTVAAVEAENGRVKAVFVTAPDGLQKIEAKMFIDCTGDACLALMAGAACEKGETLQPATLCFRVANHVLHPENEGLIREKYQKAIREGRLLDSDIWGGGSGAFAHGRGRDALSNKMHTQNPGSNANHVHPFDGADADSRTKGEIQGRRAIGRLMDFLNKEIPGYENAYVSHCCPQVSARESVRVVGERYVTGDDYINGVCPPDSVCYSFYPIDVHRADTENALDNEFHKKGLVPGIPYGALVAKGFENLLMAGRNASGDRRAHSAFRVQASCMAMGEAAGTAAAIAAKNGTSAMEVDIAEMQNALRKQGAIVPEANV